MVALVNVAALWTALGCTALLVFKRKDKAWIPILAAMIVVYSLSAIGRIRSDRLPAVPYERVSMVESSTGPIPHTVVTYSWDFLALGIACGAFIAVRRK
jgi:hypothetical protein